MKGAGELDRPIFFKTIILKGRDGTSIGSLEKTATVGATDTYTITLTDGETYTFEVTNGTSISNISYTSSSGNVDTYTVTLTDGSTTTFNVTNGEDFTVPTDGVIYYDGADIPDGYEEAPAPSGSGSYATIDDSNVSVSTTYSSSKIEQLISGVGGGGVDYSTTEQDTGLKWIDGRTIYQKTFVFENSHDKFIDDFRFKTSSLIDCMVIRGWNIWYKPNENYVVTNTAVQYGMDTVTGTVHMMYGPQADYSLEDGASGYITLQYIKLSETPNS
jgi:hypothetical protein